MVPYAHERKGRTLDEMEVQGMDNLVQDPTSEEAFVTAKREMQEAIIFKTPTLPQSFEEFEGITEDIMKGLKDEITQLGRKELDLNLAWARTKFDDESWQLLFRELAEVKQAKLYLRGMWVQLRDIISESKQEMPDATCSFPPNLPDTTDLEKKTNNLRSGEKKFAFQLLSTYSCTQLSIGQLLELKLQKAFCAGKLDQIELLAKWFQLFPSSTGEVSGDNSEGESSVWSRVEELENWLSSPGNPLVVNHST